MPEAINHQSPPQGQSVDQLMAQVLIEGHMGGNREGGVIEVGLDSTPITSRENGFKIGELPADLLMVVSPGGDIETDGINMMGIVRSRHEGNNTDADNIDLVKLGKDDHGNYFVAEDVSKRPNAVGLSVDNPLTIGRSTENIIPELELTHDPFTSAEHLSVELHSNGVIKVTDLQSSNGTGFKLMGEPEKFTREDLHMDMFDLRETLRHNKKNVSVGAVALSGVELSQKLDSIDVVPSTTKEEKVELLQTPDEQLKNNLTEKIERSHEALKEITKQIEDKDALSKLWDFGVKSAHYRATAQREEANPTHLGHRNVEGGYSLAIEAERKLPDSVRKFADDYRTHMVNRVLAQEQLNELYK